MDLNYAPRCEPIAFWRVVSYMEKGVQSISTMRVLKSTPSSSMKERVSEGQTDLLPEEKNRSPFWSSYVVSSAAQKMKLEIPAKIRFFSPARSE